MNKFEKKIEKITDFFNQHKVIKTSAQLFLIIIAGLGAVSLLAIMPGLGRAMQLFGFSSNKYYSKQLLNKLEKEGFVKIKHLANGKTEISITQDGYTRILKYNLGSMQLQKKQKWDKKWRLILFDIPEKRKVMRDALRRKIKELGLLKMQQSAYIYPHQCDKEMEFLISYFKIRPLVKYFTIERFRGDDEYKENFKI